MKWEDTVASTCRYGENAGRIWGDWDILWEDSLCDYQGSAKFLAHKNGQYVVYEWSYGSCSGCDEWEDRGLSNPDIEAEMNSESVQFTKDQLLAWGKMLEETESNSGLIKAIQRVGGLNV